MTSFTVGLPTAGLEGDQAASCAPPSPDAPSPCARRISLLLPSPCGHAHHPWASAPRRSQSFTLPFTPSSGSLGASDRERQTGPRCDRPNDPVHQGRDLLLNYPFAANPASRPNPDRGHTPSPFRLDLHTKGGQPPENRPHWPCKETRSPVDALLPFRYPYLGGGAAASDLPGTAETGSVDLPTPIIRPHVAPSSRSSATSRSC